MLPPALPPGLCDVADLPWPVFELAPDGRTVLAANVACSQAYGYRSVDLVGQPTELLFHRPDDHARLLARVSQFGFGQKGGDGYEGVDVVIRTRSGEPAYARTWLRDTEDGRLLLLLADRRDVVAAQRRAEELLGQLVALERRVESVASGTLTHALSQPLMAAMGNIELLILSGDASEEVTPRLERAYEQLDRVRQILTGSTRTRS